MLNASEEEIPKPYALGFGSRGLKPAPHPLKVRPPKTFLALPAAKKPRIVKSKKYRNPFPPQKLTG